MSTLFEWKLYATRRFLRIAPMFYIGAAFYLFLFGFGPRMWAAQGVGWGDIIKTLVLIHVWFQNSFNSVVPGGWSVGDEVCFYILLPFILALAVGSSRAVVILTAASIVATQARMAIDVFRGSWGAMSC